MKGPAERDFLVSVMAGNTCAIGGVQTFTGPQDEPAAGWGWCTGEPMSWTNWASWEPNNTDTYGAPAENVMGCFANGIWVDLADHLLWSQHYLVEWSADCNGDGIVDYGQCRDGTLADYNGNNIPDCCERGEPCVAGSFAVQLRIEGGGDGHWYQLCPVGASPAWYACLSAAERMGGTLACIGSAQEDAFVRSIQSGSPLWRDFGPWLGGFQNTGSVEPAGGWAWITGEPWTWAGWDAEPIGEPNNAGCGDGEENRLHYVACYGASPHWNDAPFSGLSNCCLSPMAVSSYIVEWSADCNNDGIVDYGQILQRQLADVNIDGVPDICQQPTCVDADLFRDFNVDGADLGILLAQWGPSTPLTVSDVNNDGIVDGADLGFLLSVWGKCP
jgi:hypothetical protein